MASNDVVVRLVADIAGLQQGMSRALKDIESLKGSTEKMGNSIGSTFKKVGGVLAGAFAIDKIKDFTMTMVEASASIQALDSMFEQTFKGDQEKAMAGITAQAKEQNINVDRLKGSWASMYGTFRGGGADANQSLELTTRYMQLAGDGSAYYDKSLEDVVSRLKSVTMGNFEAGDAIGLNFNATMLGSKATDMYGQKWQDLNQTQKEFLVLGVAEEVYKNTGAMGQGAREANSWLNVTENLKATWERFLSVIGEPALQFATDCVVNLTTKLEGAIQWVGKFSDGFKDCYSATSDLSDSLAAGFDAVGLEGLGTVVGGVADFIGSAVNEAKDLVDWWSQMGDGATILTGALATLTLAILAYNGASIAAAISSGLETAAIIALYVAEGIATIATTALSAVIGFLTSPITIVIAIIGALVTAGVLLYKNWDTIKEKASELWAWISEKWNALCEATSNAWNSMVEWIKGAWDSICTSVSEGLNSVVEWFSTGWENVKSMCSTAWEFIKNIVQVGIMMVVSIVDALFKLITLPIMFVWENVKEYVFQAWEWIKTIVTDGINAVIEGVTTFFTPIIQFFVDTWNSICESTQSLWNTIKEFLSNMFNTISDIVTTVWNGIKDFLMGIFNAIKDAVTTVWNEIKTFFINLFNSLVNLFTTIFNSIKNTVTDVFNKIKSVVVEVWEGIKTVTSNVWEGICSTVSNIVNSVKETISNVFNGILSTAKEVWDNIKSAMLKPIEAAKEKISEIVEAVKSMFNFELKFPKPKLPHFSLEGSLSLKPPSVPKLAVDWYKTGGIATDSSIVGIGEAGDEAIVPLSNKSRMKPFAQAVAGMMPDNHNTVAPESAGVTVQVGSLVVREEADIQRIAEELYRLQERNRRARGKN